MPSTRSTSTAVAVRNPLVDKVLAACAHPPPPTLAVKVEQWLSQLSEQELTLQLHAANFLGTSYFLEKTHGFKKWLYTASP